ncbi:MAG TPA: SRPBCC family protein [Chloroflexota bacterium]|nr:SRPBCC family protein [Chloroflexota bacterium]
MEFHHTVVIPAPRAKVWEFLLDIPRVGKCIPGVEKVEPLGDNKYKGTVKQRVGPIGVTLEGTMTVIETDEQAGRAAMTAEGADKRIGGAVRAKMTMNVKELGPSQTELTVDTDANIGGRLGEFGGAVIKKKADQTMEQFAKNISAQVGAG